MTEQTDQMRKMAQATLHKAKEAVSNYIAESQKARDKVDSSVHNSYANLKEMNEKATTFAEANVSAGFELAQKLLDANDPQEIGRIYQDHLKDQLEKLNGQFRELGSLMSRPAQPDK